MKIHTIHRNGIAFFKNLAVSSGLSPYAETIIYDGLLKKMPLKIAKTVAEIHPGFTKYYTENMCILYKTYRFKGGTENPVKAIESLMSKKEKLECKGNPYVVIWQILGGTENTISKPKPVASDKELIMRLLPTEKEAQSYVNGSFGYGSDSLDRERSFISGAEWVRDTVIMKLDKHNKIKHGKDL